MWRYRVTQVCARRLQRHLMGCVLKQEDESVASGRIFGTRAGAVLARHITGAVGGGHLCKFRSVKLCFVLKKIIYL